MLDYFEIIYDDCESLVKNTLIEEKSGFDWLPTNRMELHLYNIRHIQHHTGQLVERLRQNGVKGIRWETMSSE
jgi:uncharacterized damage-inducible protein DinB